MSEEVIENTTKYKNKRQKAEDFIGRTFNDGKLKVIGIHKKSQNGKPTTYKVTCTECSKDPELFPDGYFISQKWNLIKGQKPCGCSKKPEWEDWQFLILARKVGEKKGFIVHGFAEEFKNAKTKLNLECIKDGFKWSASIDDIINKGSGCAKCSNKYKPTEQEALQNCVDICKEMNYDVIGFVDGYRTANKTRFEYICKIHGKQNVNYSSFVNNGSRCKGCWKDRQLEILRDNGNGNGYYPERKDETDFLYVLDFDGKFIKVGRSFDVDERINSLRTASKIPKKRINKLRIFTATHQEIYDYEQELHSELREHNFQYYVGWSTECFDNDALFILNKMLDICYLTEL
ncbi:hypothetical protein vBAcePPAc_0201 [Aeromonas phage vB_AceP_PAc]|nr:hypothetical protein vBAcePPAc_0201 [Aeromonas phage vB_AceP_PAc]